MENDRSTVSLEKKTVIKQNKLINCFEKCIFQSHSKPKTGFKLWKLQKKLSFPYNCKKLIISETAF